MAFATRIQLALGVLLAAALHYPATTVSASEEASTTYAEDALVSGNADFAFALYQKLRTNEGNLFFSPLSISTALAMTYAGARGTTAEEMASVLNFPSPDDSVHRSFRTLSARLRESQQRSGIELHIANSLWPHVDHPVLDQYLALVKKDYNSEIISIDFAANPKTAQQKINTWVENNTQKKIRDVIGDGMLTELTRLVLVNAIYFKAAWAARFDPNRTEEAEFFLRSDQSVQVPMMQAKQQVLYFETDQFQAVQLAYSGSTYSMLLIVPKEELSGFEIQLSRQMLDELRSNLVSRQVLLSIPKFTLESTFSLSQTLKMLGMKLAFDELHADFSGIDGQSNWLYISEVVHKAFVEVSEEGTEAAAATAVIMATRSAAMVTPTFKADRPFFFVIQEDESKTLLFVGRVSNPK